VIPSLLPRLLRGESLTEAEAQAVIGHVMDGDASEAQIAGLLVALRMKGESVDEIVGAARAMRTHAIAVVPRRRDLVDTCGTGGDGLRTFNVSTAAGLVAAGAGAGVAKHGNRAVSSASGSADVLEALGVRVDLPAERVAECIDEVGFGFLFAPAHHPAMRHAAPVRRSLGVRTIFNVLGPLTNPVGARRQLVGVFDEALVVPIAETLRALGSERALVVHGSDGLDELSPGNPSTCADVTPEGVTVRTIDPATLGLARSRTDELAGGDAAANADLLRALLDGELGARRDAVALNAGAALVAAGRADDLAAGLALAIAAIDDGRARLTLERLVEFTNA
jgi:anthranilate phosphoribosyltransferase